MRSNLVRAVLVCAALALPATATMASNNPIPGVDVIVKKNPGGNAITATTDTDGRITLKGLAPGDYEIDIDGPSLVAAMDKLVPAPKKKSGSSFSLGIGGGMFGGGSHRSSSSGKQGAGPVQGGAPGGPSGGHGNSRANGGFESEPGVGMNIPIGDSGPQDALRAPIWVWVAMLPEHSPGDLNSGTNGTTGPGVFHNGLSVATSYCRDSAAQGMRIHFTIPAGPANSDYDGWYIGFGVGY